MFLVGVLIGLYIVIKPYMVPIFIWILVRKEYHIFNGAVAVLVIFSIFSILSYGLIVHFEYIDLLRFLSSRGESFFQNHSVNGLLNRMFFLGPNLEWDGLHTKLRYNVFVHLATAVNFIFILASSVWVSRRFGEQARLVDFMIGLTSVMLSSSLIFEYQYGIFVVIYLIMFCFYYNFRNQSIIKFVLLFVSFVFCAVPFRMTSLLAETSWNFVQSHMLFGAWIILGILHNCRLRLMAKDEYC